MKEKKARLTIIIAPAGYGKSTALSQWVKQSDILAAWISLDKQDDNFTRFWNYVLAAIKDVQPNLEESEWPKTDSFQEPLFEPIITQLINALNSLPHDLLLILDDFHLIELPSIYNSVAYLLERLPSHIHLYIASRSSLSLPTARLRATGELHTINVHDLRFQLNEAMRFFQQCMGLTLSEDDVSRLTLHTEGWISGLHMAALSLKKTQNQSDFIRQFNGQQRDISSYLLEEVFHQQSDPMREFLIKTSILNRMNSSLCEALTGLTECQAILELLEQQNLFIVPLDEQRDWYRYHHLFADFLQRHLLKKHPEQWAQSHENAATWLEL